MIFRSTYHASIRPRRLARSVATELMLRTNRRFHTEFNGVLRADYINGVCHALVLDSSGRAWLCKEERIHHESPVNLRVLMPVWGPARWPLKHIPESMGPAIEAFLEGLPAQDRRAA